MKEAQKGRSGSITSALNWSRRVSAGATRAERNPVNVSIGKSSIE